MRQRAGVYTLRPGITGLSQLCGDPPPRVKAEIDRLYLASASAGLDGAIVLSTVLLLWGRQREKANIAIRKIRKFFRNF